MTLECVFYENYIILKALTTITIIRY